MAMAIPSKSIEELFDDDDYMTEEEFQLFISTFDKSNIYELLYFTTFWFFFMTGVRTSELQAIEWSKIDF